MQWVASTGAKKGRDQPSSIVVNIKSIRSADKADVTPHPLIGSRWGVEIPWKLVGDLITCLEITTTPNKKQHHTRSGREHQSRQIRQDRGAHLNVVLDHPQFRGNVGRVWAITSQPITVLWRLVVGPRGTIHCGFVFIRALYAFGHRWEC